MASLPACLPAWCYQKNANTTRPRMAAPLDLWRSLMQTQRAIVPLKIPSSQRKPSPACILGHVPSSVCPQFRLSALNHNCSSLALLFSGFQRPRMPSCHHHAGIAFACCVMCLQELLHSHLHISASVTFCSLNHALVCHRRYILMLAAASVW